MQRLTFLAGAAALTASALVAAPAATADTGDVCVAANDRAFLDDPIFYPFVQVETGVPFSITAGACSATGTLDEASCGNSYGTGVLTVDGHQHDFQIVTAGGLVVVTGNVVGVFTAIPDVPGGESCAEGSDGADVFIINGSAVTSDTAVPRPSPSILS